MRGGVGAAGRRRAQRTAEGGGYWDRDRCWDHLFSAPPEASPAPPGMGAAALRSAALSRPDESSPKQVSEEGARAVSGSCSPAACPEAGLPSQAGREPALPGWAVSPLPSAPFCFWGSPRIYPLYSGLLLLLKELAHQCRREGREEKGGCPGWVTCGRCGVWPLPPGRGSSRAAPQLGWAPPPPPARSSLGKGNSPGPSPPLPLQGAGGPALGGRMW